MRIFGKIGSRFGWAVAAATLAVGLSVGAGSAQTQTRVDVQTDWAVFEAGEGASKVCWIVSLPESKTATRGGKTVEVNRGDIFLMVAVRPQDGVKNEVSFIAGYPFKKGSEVEVSVGSSTFKMFTDGENAWLPSASEDANVVSSFRRGAKAKVKGVSTRGTTTVDTFSLSGFTAAMKSASSRCG
ncbi:MAG: invasion associated locus B family protein [Pseudomonadota bacterium]